MSPHTKKHDQAVEPPAPIKPPLTMKELAVLLAKHYDLKEGLFDILIEFKMAFGAVGPTKDETLPGAIVGVSKIGLVPTQRISSTTIDAAEANKPKRSRRKKIEGLPD